MKVEIYGNTVASACAALSAKAKGHEVVWFCTKSDPRKEELRPLRINRKQFRQIAELARTIRCPLNTLNKAHEVIAYSTLTAKPLNDIWPKNEKHRDYWVDGSALIQEIKSYFRDSSIRMIESEVYPKFMGNTANVVIADVLDSQLELWSRRLFNQSNQGHVQSFGLQMQFAKNPRQKPGFGKIFKFRGALAFIEPCPGKGSVLSLYSNKRSIIDDCAQILRRNTDIKSGIPLELSILLTLNPGIFLRRYEYKIGISSVIAPGLFPIGSSVGSLFPELNQQASMGLEHLKELEPILAKYDARNQVKVYGLSERWISQKRRRLERQLYLAKLWKKAIFSSENQRLALSAHSAIPPFLRQTLGSPL